MNSTKLMNIFLSWIFVVCLSCFLVVNSQEPIVAQAPGGVWCGPSFCPVETFMCFVTMKSSDNDTKITKCGTCLGQDGNIIKESTKIDPNTGMNRTDITSINIMNLNATNGKEILNTVAAVVKGMLAKNAGGNVPYVQITTPSAGPNQISTIQGLPPTNQIIIVQPPAPQIVYRDKRFDLGPREYFENFNNKINNICQPLDCPDTKSTVPLPQQNPYQSEGPKYPMPNVQPTVLVEIHKCIDAIAWYNRRLRELVRDASAGLGTPYLEQNMPNQPNIPRPAFPILTPQASFRRK